MSAAFKTRRLLQVLLALLMAPCGLGCRLVASRPCPPGGAEFLAHHENEPPPSEKSKTSLPSYVIEPPDILLIDALRVVPKPPYKIELQDLLGITVAGTEADQPIAGTYRVEPGGMVSLGPVYGKVKVAGLTLEEASDAIDRHLRRALAEPEVSLTLAEAATLEQIIGERIVGSDGMVNLGTYDKCYVAGMTIEEAKAAIEKHLEQFLDKPEVSVDVFSYNSKVYYVVTQGAGQGDSAVSFPITGNETVLDAITQVQGLSRLSSKNIWIARPSPNDHCQQILPVKWHDITQGAATGTNYQLFPGDRVYIAEDRMIAWEACLTKITGPFERIFGFALLGTQTIQTLNRFPDGQQF